MKIPGSQAAGIFFVLISCHAEKEKQVGGGLLSSPLFLINQHCFMSRI